MCRALCRLDAMEADLFAAKKEAQAEMLSTVQDLKQQMHILEKKVDKAESSKDRILVRARCTRVRVVVPLFWV